MAIDVKNKKDLEVKIIRDSQIWNYLPSPENIIRGSMRGLRIYDDMKEDARVGSLFEDRRNATRPTASSLRRSYGSATGTGSTT